MKTNDETPLRIRYLARYIGIGKNAVYASMKAGYVFEFATLKMTTPGHFKAWLRQQASLLSDRVAGKRKEDEERQQRELHHQRSGAGKSHARPSNRDSQTASPGPAKSSRSPQPA